MTQTIVCDANASPVLYPYIMGTPLLTQMQIRTQGNALYNIVGTAGTSAALILTLDNVRAYAETGAEFVSCGAITHSARAMDISFRLEVA